MELFQWKLVVILGTFWLVLPILVSMLKIPDIKINYARNRSRTMNYFIAGIFSQPEEAFSFLSFNNFWIQTETGLGFSPNGVTNADFFSNEGIAYVEIGNYGVDYAAIARKIAEDVRHHGYRHVRIFTISIGDISARVIDQLPSEAFNHAKVELFEINPCGEPKKFLKQGLPAKLFILSFFVTLSELILGPFSFAPFFKRDNHHFSLCTIAGWVRSLAFEDTKSDHASSRTTMVVISSHDQYLNNSAIANYYKKQIIHTVYTEHADTIENARAYFDVFNEYFRGIGK